MAATNQYYKHLTNKEDLAGIPEAILAQYEEEAKERNLEGYVITLQFPSLLPILTYAENRELRKELAIANGKNLLMVVNLTTKKSHQRIGTTSSRKSAIVRLQIFCRLCFRRKNGKISTESVRIFERIID